MLGAVTGPDLQIRWLGRSHKKTFRAFWPQFGLNIRVATRGPSPGSGTRGIPAMDLEEQRGEEEKWQRGPKLYTCQLFLSQMREIFILPVTGVSENVPLTLEDF